jgi:NADH:ubiquinone oxidoreductase subunit 11 or 4L (chain K)
MIDVLIAILVILPAFAIGVFGLLARRHFIRIIISVEIALNAVILTIGVFSALNGAMGEAIGIFILFIVAMEVAIGLAIAIQMDKVFQTVDIYATRKIKD